MREILFRGKRLDNGEWVFGDLIRNLIYDGREKEMRIGDIYFEHNGDMHGTAVYKVIPETVGQFTGLTDKNGKKIFEGDIIAKGFERYEVQWNAEQLRWGIYLEGYEVAGFTKFSEPFFEIISNIHDNPELFGE